MQPTRRHVLLAAGVAAVACAEACTADKPLRPTVPSTKDTLRGEAVAREQQLVAAYSASLPRHPAHADLLTGFLTDHAAHLVALTGDPAPSPTATSSTSPGLPLTLRELADLEKKAARQHASAAERAGVDCDADSLALLLASLAACEAAHVVLL